MGLDIFFMMLHFFFKCHFPPLSWNNISCQGRKSGGVDGGIMVPPPKCQPLWIGTQTHFSSSFKNDCPSKIFWRCYGPASWKLLPYQFRPFLWTSKAFTEKKRKSAADHPLNNEWNLTTNFLLFPNGLGKANIAKVAPHEGSKIIKKFSNVAIIKIWSRSLSNQ